MIDVFDSEKRSAIMANVKSEGTKPEILVESMLKELGIQYRRQVRSLPGKPDFVIDSHQTIIFVHGCFWHMHRNCCKASIPETNRKFWEDKLNKNRKRDRRNVDALRKAGWHVLTIWECRLSKSESVQCRIERFLATNDQHQKQTP